MGEGDVGARVLFLCTHNSARSQMAEAILRSMGAGRAVVESAGTEVTGVNPYAVRAMQERGISMEGARSKHLDEFIDQEWDYVITTCDSANESCPIFPGARNRLHWSLPDPSAVIGSDEEKLAAFRARAEDLTERINNLLYSIEQERPSN